MGLQGEIDGENRPYEVSLRYSCLVQLLASNRSKRAHKSLISRPHNLIMTEWLTENFLPTDNGELNQPTEPHQGECLRVYLVATTKLTTIRELISSYLQQSTGGGTSSCICCCGWLKLDERRPTNVHLHQRYSGCDNDLRHCHIYCDFQAQLSIISGTLIDTATRA